MDRPHTPHCAEEVHKEISSRIRIPKINNDFVYYDPQDMGKSCLSLYWSPKKPLLHSTSDEDNTYMKVVRRQHSMYKIRKDQAIEKKIHACGRSPITVVHSETNSVITFSTTSFELMRTVTQQYFKDSAILECNQKVDEQDIIEQDIIKVFFKTKTNVKSKHMITVNLYRTTSLALVNGPSIKKFQTSIYPSIVKVILDLYDIDIETRTKAALQNETINVFAESGNVQPAISQALQTTETTEGEDQHHTHAVEVAPPLSGVTEVLIHAIEAAPLSSVVTVVHTPAIEVIIRCDRGLHYSRRGPTFHN